MELHDWHQRFKIQAKWTTELRNYLFDVASINKSMRILDIGCGTGAILQDLNNNSQIHGLDISYKRLQFAKNNVRKAKFTMGNALALPYKDKSFDIAYCHYLLLWVSNPQKVLKEFKRVTKPGGHIIAIAEPDYSERIDKPISLAKLGELQTQSLIKQGANPNIGKDLKPLFNNLGLSGIESGILNQDNTGDFSKDTWESEWLVLTHDLNNLSELFQLEEFKKIDLEAWISGKRKLFIPTHYAIGTVN